MGGLPTRSFWDIFCVGFLLSVVFRECSPQNLNSRPNVESLLYMEAELIDFCQYALEEEQRLHKGQDVHGFSDMYKLIEEVKPISNAALEKVTSIADDILQIYAVKSRLSRIWAPILERIHDSEFIARVPVTKRRIESIQEVIGKQCNLHQTSIEDIFRIQEYYKLPADLLAGSGDLSYIEVKDVVRLVGAANDRGDHQLALNWIKFGIRISNATTDLNTKKFFLNLKAATYIRMQKYAKAEKIFAYLAKNDPNSRAAQSNLKFIRDKLQEAGKDSAKAELPATNATKEYTMQLCRGNVVPSPSLQPLKCYVKYIEDLEEAVRIEEIHHNPRIVILRDLLHKAELTHIKDAMSKKMMSRMIRDETYKSFIPRLQQRRNTKWLEKYISTLMNVTFQDSNVRRKEIFSKIMVENEGPGGSAVSDVFQLWKMHKLEDTLPIGNFILFMSDVVSGGGVAFPDLHLKIEPEEGSVLFWQFKSQHGPVHPKLRHYVKCPVVRGSQWLARTQVEHRGLVRLINL